MNNATGVPIRKTEFLTLVSVTVSIALLVFGGCLAGRISLRDDVNAANAKIVSLETSETASIAHEAMRVDQVLGLQTRLATAEASATISAIVIEALADKLASDGYTVSIGARGTVTVSKPAPPKVTISRSRSIAGVEQWRSLVAKYFKAQYVDAALSVMMGESGGNPNAVNSSSGCAGLFQQHPRYWAARSAKAGFAGASILDPEANVATSAMLSNGGASWSHWSVKP